MKMRFMIVLILVFILLSNCAQALTDNEKIKIFYKNEWLFFFGIAGNVDIKTVAEEASKAHKGKPYTLPILSIEEISNEYRSIVKEYLSIFNTYTETNLAKFKEYYELLDLFYKNKDRFDKGRFDNVEKYLTAKMKNELLPKLKNGIRIMLAIKDTQYIEVAKEIDNNKYAVTTLDKRDIVYWFRYLEHPTLMGIKREDILDSQGVIKYHEFFYESNMKIRIIKQIRDENGNYYGELYADYYKLDQFDKLFDEKGNPRKLNK